MVVLNDLRILYWNCSSAVQNRYELINLSKNYDIIALQETHLKPENIYNLKGFNAFRKDRLSAGGGLVTFLRDDLMCEIVKSTFHKTFVLETLSIKIKIENDKFLIFTNIYRPPNNDSFFNRGNHWSKFINSLQFSSNNSHIIVGDFNAHSLSWGSHKDCPIGDSLIDHLFDTDLLILNSKELTHYPLNLNQPSAIDLAICSIDLFPYCKWSTLDGLFGSDHKPIEVTVMINSQTYSSKSHRINLKKVDWIAFKNYLDNETLTNSEFFNSLTQNEKYSQFSNLILQAIDSSLISDSQTSDRHHGVSTSRKKVHPSNIWWDKKCEEARQARITAEKNFIKNPNIDTKIEKNRTAAIAKKIYKLTKRESFKEFCNSLGGDTPSKVIWNKLKKFYNKNVDPYAEFNSTINMSLRTHIDDFKKSLTTAPKVVHPFPDQTKFRENIYLDSEITLSEFKLALKETKKDSSPGLDKICYSILMNLPDNAMIQLCKIFNEILNSHTVPDEWLNYLVILIPKNKLGKFRPIALAQCSLKVLERIINKRIVYHCEKTHVFSQYQFGFRKGKSCPDNLSILTNDIRSAFLNNCVTSAFFVDVKGAFDNVNPTLIPSILAKIGIPYKITKFISNLISNRTLYFKINGVIEAPELASNGLPQGSVLSPTLFNIYLHDIYHVFENDVKYLLYADDLVFYKGLSINYVII